MSGVSGLPASAEALGCQTPPPTPGSPLQLLPLPPSGLRDGRSPGPGPPKSDGRAQVAGIMGLLRPLRGLQPETRTFVRTASCEASPQTFLAVEEAARGACGPLLPAGTPPWVRNPLGSTAALLHRDSSTGSAQPQKTSLSGLSTVSGVRKDECGRVWG